MSIINLTRPLIAGFLHSFEPDHMSAVSVLAAENVIQKKKTTIKTALKTSKWALGHSVTLLLFGGIALLFKSGLENVVTDISYWAGVSVGPIMIWLGIMAIRRNHKINDRMGGYVNIQAQEHSISDFIQIYGKSDKKTATNPLNKSFWIGMLHGLAGTGGVLTSALVMSAETFSQAILVLILESVGIILAMGVYSYILMYSMRRFIELNMSVFKWINAIIGLISILVGFMFISDIFFAG